jgi:catechol 2,3-dioxygenase-like lactoylglutathione lyase family enzyme
LWGKAVTLVKRHSHTGLSTPDLDVTERFYVNVIGLEVAFEFRNDENERYGFFLTSGNGTFVEFFKVSFSEYRTSGPLRHICFEVEDIQSYVIHLASKGTFTNVKRGRKDQVLQCFIIDPHGIHIEIQQHDERSALHKFVKAGDHD